MSITTPESLAARTMLTMLQTGAFRVNRLHKPETRAENERHNIKDRARVTVRISDHKALSDLTKLHARAYQEHKRLTLPTIQDGIRLLPSARVFDHAQVMQKYSDRHNELVRAFMADYDQERVEAPTKLNGLYDASLWPPHSVVATKFKFATRYLATPTDGSWGDWLMESAEAAEADLKERLTEALERVRDRCKSDGKLYASVFDSIRDLVALVPELDITDSFAPVVQAMQPLTILKADGLRDDDMRREQTAIRADSILTLLGGIS